MPLYRQSVPISDAKLIAAMIRTLDPKSGRGVGWLWASSSGLGNAKASRAFQRSRGPFFGYQSGAHRLTG